MSKNSHRRWLFLLIVRCIIELMERTTPIITQPGEPGAALRNIYDLSPERLASEIASWGQPFYRAAQILRWLYRELVTDFSQMTNLPLDLRRRLAAEFRIGSAELVAQKVSIDGWTRKVLLKMRDGNTIEAVLMLYYDRPPCASPRRWAARWAAPSAPPARWASPETSPPARYWSRSSGSTGGCASTLT